MKRTLIAVFFAVLIAGCNNNTAKDEKATDTSKLSNEIPEDNHVMENNVRPANQGNRKMYMDPAVDSTASINIQMDSVMPMVDTIRR